MDRWIRTATSIYSGELHRRDVMKKGWERWRKEMVVLSSAGNIDQVIHLLLPPRRGRVNTAAWGGLKHTGERATGSKHGQNVGGRGRWGLEGRGAHCNGSVHILQEEKASIHDGEDLRRGTRGEEGRSCWSFPAKTIPPDSMKQMPPETHHKIYPKHLLDREVHFRRGTLAFQNRRCLNY